VADADVQKVLTRQLTGGACQKRVADWTGQESPYMEYWLTT
jgi:hypothetical protein